MKAVLLIFLVIALTSCNSAAKLFTTTTADKGRIVAKKGYFSGIHYIYIEKTIKRKLQYSIIYDCECSSTHKITLRKSDRNADGSYESWTSVTDTIGGLKMFNEELALARFSYPLEFKAITFEELNALKTALTKVNKECCLLPEKLIRKIIGYVKLKRN